MLQTKKTLRGTVLPKTAFFGAGTLGQIQRRGLMLLAFLALANGLYAQDNANGPILYWSLNGGLGTSDVLVEGMSFNLVLEPRIGLSPALMLGNKNIINISTDEIVTLETQAYLRWNFLRLGSRQNTTDIFAQCGIGLLAAFRGTDVTQTRGSMLFDMTAGITIPLSDRWQLEPSFRIGYPFIGGASITAGIKFPLRQPARTEYVEVIRTLPPIETVRTIMIALVEYIIFGPDISDFNVGIDADARSLNELVLYNVAKVLKDNPDYLVRIEGHANPVTHETGEIQILLSLSRERANVVAGQLRDLGVDEGQISVAAHGGTRILASDHDHWNMNRRVELMVIQGFAE